MKQAEVYHNYGWEARKEQDFKKAIQFYNKALEFNPNHFKAYFNRGFAYDRLGDVDNAIKDYNNALKIDPNNAFCYYNQGISYEKKNNPEKAVILCIILDFKFHQSDQNRSD